jgi:gliding motility-associated-like protein
LKKQILFFSQLSTEVTGYPNHFSFYPIINAIIWVFWAFTKRLSHPKVYTFFLLLSHFALYAQPEPCGPNPQMTPNCINACVICDIDGYVGINNSTLAGQEPPGFCTTTAHHMQWIAFIAGTPNLTITVTPSNCDEGYGLEVGIYQSFDCNSFQLVSNCDGDIQEGQVGVFTNTVPLIVGQYYYFVMDGNRDDVCQYLINVTSGSTMVPPLPAAGPIQGPDTICVSSVTRYTIPSIIGATNYRWTLNGTIINADLTLDVEFFDPGENELCAYAYNVCDTTALACRTITVLPAPSSQVSLSVCAGSWVEFGDTTICDPGMYSFVFNTIHGCDSTVILIVEEQPFVESFVSTTICATDSIQINDIWYQPPGQYDVTLTATNGCDSILHLDLQSIDCEINGTLLSTAAICHGEVSGSLNLEVHSGTAPFSYTWQNAGSGLTGSGNISDINSPVTISNLAAGLYVITISDSFGNDLILSTTVAEPEAIAIQLAPSDYHGFGVSCFGATDGSLMANVTGGTPGYTYGWDPIHQGNQFLNIGAGDYTLTVTDMAGCISQAAFTLSTPDPLTLNVEFLDPDCASEQSGQIDVISSTGGALPYLYAINGGPFENASVFNGLSAGSYQVSIQDANGCIAGTNGVLTGVIIPAVNVGDDIEIDLGYSATLNAFTTPADAIIEWSPSIGLSCVHCLDPIASPFVTTTFALTAISADGCIVSDSLTIIVRKPKDDVYIPNVFSPNGDGLNDRFTVFGGRSVKQVEKLSIFSRWGDLILEAKSFMANDLFSGWDGTFRDQPVSPGVFTWMAEIRYLDDSIATFSGDVTVVR